MPKPNAQYVIDIAAQMSGFDSTVVGLNKISARLAGVGKDSAVFSDAITQLSEQLGAARAASSQTSAALAAGATEYRQLEKSADTAARAYERLVVKEAELQVAAGKAASEERKLGKAVSDAAGRVDELRVASDAARAALAAGVGKYKGFSGRGIDTEINRLKTQAAEAAAAFKAGAADFGILERQESAAAKTSARLSSQLKGLGLDKAKVKADAAAASVTAFAGKLGKLEREAEGAAGAERKLGKQFIGVQRIAMHHNKVIGDAATKLSTFRGALGDVGGPAGELGEKLLYPVQAFVDIREYFGRGAAVALVATVGFLALAAAAVVLTAALVAGVAVAAAFAIKLGDTRRAAELVKEAFDAMNPALANLPFAQVTRDTGIAGDRLQELAKSLRDAKVAADDMPAALRAAAIAEAALGQGGADSFIADMKAGKLAVQEFAATTEQKLGGIVARQMLGLEAQGARFRSNIGSLFGGLDIEPALKGLRTLVALFDENEVAGKAIKLLFEKIFQPLIDQAQNAAYVIEAFAIGFLIGMTKLYIALKPTIKAVADFFGFDDTSLADVLTSAKNAGELAFKVFLVGVAVFTLIAGAIAAVVAVAVGLAAFLAGALYIAIKNVIGIVTALKDIFMLIAPAIERAWASFVGWASSIGSTLVGLFSDAWSSVLGYLSGVSLVDVGLSLIKGLALGVTSGVSVVVNAVKNAVGGAIKAAKSALGIASPSKVFADVGVSTTEGYASGVDAAAPAADEAVRAMVAPPLSEITIPALDVAMPTASAPVPALVTPRQGPGAEDQTQSSAGKASLDLHGATFNFYGVEGAEDAEARFGELLTRAVEGDATALGAAQGAEA